MHADLVFWVILIDTPFIAPMVDPPMGVPMTLPLALVQSWIDRPTTILTAQLSCIQKTEYSCSDLPVPIPLPPNPYIYSSGLSGSSRSGTGLSISCGLQLPAGQQSPYSFTFEAMIEQTSTHIFFESMSLADPYHFQCHAEWLINAAIDLHTGVPSAEIGFGVWYRPPLGALYIKPDVKCTLLLTQYLPE
jgi:hypothetical protein